MNSLSDSINHAFQEATSSHGPCPLTDAANRHSVLSGLSAPDLVHQTTDAPAAPAVLDQLWPAVIDSYRVGPSPFWGAVVLKMVLPTLLDKVADLRYEPKLADDVDQQLISGVLHAAATGRLPDPARWTPNRLATRAVTRTGRWLEAETRARCLYLLELPERPAEPAPARDSDHDDLATLQALLRPAGLEDATVMLLYRNRVLGEALAGIAEELCLNDALLRMRRLRALERIRRHLAA